MKEDSIWIQKSKKINFKCCKKTNFNINGTNGKFLLKQTLYRKGEQSNDLESGIIYEANMGPKFDY